MTSPGLVLNSRSESCEAWLTKLSALTIITSATPGPVTMHPRSRRSALLTSRDLPRLTVTAESCSEGKLGPDDFAVVAGAFRTPPMTEGGNHGQAAPAFALGVCLAGLEIQRTLIPSLFKKRSLLDD